MKKAILYLRSSSEDGLQKQKEELLNYCQQHKIHISNIYYEDFGYSGMTFDRPAWNRMMSELKQVVEREQLLLVTSYDRICRNYNRAIEMHEKLKDMEVTIKATLTQRLQAENFPASDSLADLLMSVFQENPIPGKQKNTQCKKLKSRGNKGIKR